MDIDQCRKFQKERAEYYKSKFPNAKKEKDEKHGDFIIDLNERVVGFEVYTPDAQLSLSTKTLMERTKEYVKKNGRVIGEGFGGGLDQNRFAELVYRALENKGGQFNEERVNHSKILIIDCMLPGSFNSVSVLISEWDEMPTINNPFCSSVFVASSFGFQKGHYIQNQNAKFQLTNEEHKYVLTNLNRVYSSPA